MARVKIVSVLNPALAFHTSMPKTLCSGVCKLTRHVVDKKLTTTTKYDRDMSGLKTPRRRICRAPDPNSVIIHPGSLIKVHVFTKIMDRTIYLIRFLNPARLRRSSYALYRIISVSNPGFGSLQSAFPLDYVPNVIMMRNDHSWL